MKKVINMLLVGIIVLLFPVQVISAATRELEPSKTPTPTPVEYPLPYPGLLPGHPFYFLKIQRDKLLGFLISNPLKKAEFDLLQADKRVEASAMLVDQKKPDLAVSTLAEARMYFEEAISKISEANKKDPATHAFVKKLALANLKHQEILKNLEKKNKEKFSSERNSFEELGKKVKDIQQ